MQIFQNLFKFEDFSNFGKNEDFSNFGKKWRFFKIWSKLKIFQIMVKIDVFSNFGIIEAMWFLCDLFKFEDFSNGKTQNFKMWSKLKIFQFWYNWWFLKVQNWRFFNFVWFLAKIDYFQILAINEDFSKFSQNCRFKFCQKLMIFQLH